jgi:hypothetical protein
LPSAANPTVTAGRQTHRLQMFHLSEIGVRIAPNPGLQKGSAVTVDGGDGPVRATVVWTSPTEAGLSFDQVLADVPAKRTMPSADRPSAAA